MIFLFLLFFVGSSTVHCWAQDEKFIRQVLTENLNRNVGENPSYEFKWQKHSGAFNLDLDNDGLYEKLYISKKDGQDWFTITDSNTKIIFEKKLQAKGKNSEIFKIRLFSLSRAHKAMVLHFYEGGSDFVNTYGSARLAFVTWDNNDLSTLSILQGPSFFDEVRLGDKHYHQREYLVNVYDFNGDGIKEVAVQFTLIQRIYFYQGRGKWSRI